MILGIDLGTTNTSVFSSGAERQVALRFTQKHPLYNSETVLPTVSLKISEAARNKILAWISAREASAGYLIGRESILDLLKSAQTCVGVQAGSDYQRLMGLDRGMSFARNPAVKEYDDVGVSSGLVELFAYNFKKQVNAEHHARFEKRKIDDEFHIVDNLWPDSRYEEHQLSYALSAVFRHILTSAGGEPNQLVVGLPVKFDSRAVQFYRQVLRNIAPRVEVHFVWEPVAMMYGSGIKTNNAKSLVFDMGGGTLDLALFSDGKLVGSSGRSQAGSWIDDLVLEMLFSQEQRNLIEKTDWTKALTLKFGENSIESAKIRLSRSISPQRVTAYLLDSPGSNDMGMREVRKLVDASLTREGLLNCYQKAWELYLPAIEECCNGTKPDTVVMGGGGSMIPWFQERMRTLFPTAELIFPANDLESVTQVARGLASIGSSQDLRNLLSADRMIELRETAHRESLRVRRDKIKFELEGIEKKVRPFLDQLERYDRAGQIEAKLLEKKRILAASGVRCSQAEANCRERRETLIGRSHSLEGRLERVSRLILRYEAQRIHDVSERGGLERRLAETKGRLKKIENGLKFQLYGQLKMDPATKDSEVQNRFSQLLAEMKGGDPRFQAEVEIKTRLSEIEHSVCFCREAVERCQTLKNRITDVLKNMNVAMEWKVALLARASAELMEHRELVSSCERELQECRRSFEDVGGEDYCKAQIVQLNAEKSRLLVELQYLDKSPGPTDSESTRKGRHTPFRIIASSDGVGNYLEGGGNLQDFAREEGKFGSFPMYDSMDDESSP